MGMEALIETQTLIENFNRKSEEIPDRLKTLVSEVAFIYQNCIMDEAPVITHNLQAATTIENIDDYTSRVYVDEGTAPYAIYVILGTSPHEIFPKSAGALFWPGADHPVPSVLHPGTAPNPYFDHGAEMAKIEADMEVENFIQWLTE